MSDNQTTTTQPPAPSAEPPAQSTEAPASQSTSAPASGTTTAAPPSGSTTAAPSAGAPTITAKIAIDPDDGTEQNPLSLQVAASAKLTLSWTGTNAASVRIDGIGDGLDASGSQSIDTQDMQYSIVAVGADGSESQPLVISVATHADGDVASPHTDLGSGIAAILSFCATKAGVAVTSASVGDTITLTAICSAATDSATIGGTAATLSDTADGNKQATADVTIAEGATGDFDCEVSASGTAGDPGSVHIDIAPAPASTTTAAPGDTTTASPAQTTTVAPPASTTQPPTTTTHPPTTTTAPSTTTTAPGTTTTAAPGTTTTAPGTTTTAPGTTTTAPGTTTTAPGTTTTAPGTTTTLNDGSLQNPAWGADVAAHGQSITLTVTAPASASGKTVYFIVEKSEDNEQTWTQVGSELQGTVDASGTATASVTIEDDDGPTSTTTADPNGSANGSAAPTSSGHTCMFRFHASFNSAGGGGQ